MTLPAKIYTARDLLSQAIAESDGSVAAAPATVAAYDGTPADALRLARLGINPITGAPAFGSEGDLATARDLAVRANADPYLITGSAALDSDAREFLVMVNQTKGGGMQPLGFNVTPQGPTLADAIAALSSGGPAGQG